MYIKARKHTKLNTKRKISVSNFEEMELDDTIVSSEGDRVYDLVREGNISIALKDIYIYIYICFMFLKSMHISV